MAKMTTRDLGVVIESIGKTALESQKKAVFNASLHIKKTVEAERNKDLKGKDYFSQMMEKKTRSGNFVGVRPETHRLSIGFNVRGTYNPTALLVARGPWGLLEYGAAPHDINARPGTRTRGARARRQRDLNIAFRAQGAFSGASPMGSRKRGFGPVYRVGNHPGTKGKKTFSEGVRKATPKATDIATSMIQSRVIQQLRTQFGTTTYIDNKGAFKPVVG